jgi:hypothetical protein
MPSVVTVDHKEIKRWAQMHGAVPAQFIPMHHDGEPAQLQFLFPNNRRNDTGLKPISWEDFFASFDVMELALMYELHEDASGSTRQNQIVHRRASATGASAEEIADA